MCDGVVLRKRIESASDCRLQRMRRVASLDEEIAGPGASLFSHDGAGRVSKNGRELGELEEAVTTVKPSHVGDERVGEHSLAEKLSEAGVRPNASGRCRGSHGGVGSGHEAANGRRRRRLVEDETRSIIFSLGSCRACSVAGSKLKARFARTGGGCFHGHAVKIASASPGGAISYAHNRVDRPSQPLSVRTAPYSRWGSAPARVGDLYWAARAMASSNCA